MTQDKGRARSLPTDVLSQERSTQALEQCFDRCFEAGSQQFPRILWSQKGLAAAWVRHTAVKVKDDSKPKDTALTHPALTGAAFTDAAPKIAELAASEFQDQDEAALRDEFLRLACLEQVPGAIETFEREYLLPLAPILEKRCGDAVLVDETLQQLRHKLLLGETPRLASYQSTGHLRAWLQVVAVRSLQDLARQRGARWARETPLVQHLSSREQELDSRLIKGELDQMFVMALREVVSGLVPQERYALRMHLLAGWNVSQIGETLGIHRATAARWIVSAKQQLNDNVRALLRERLDLGEAEMERLFCLLSTQLDLRLSQVFQTSPELGAVSVSDARSNSK